jgi:hypothetical protein
MYTVIDFKSKAAIRRALAEGAKVEVYQPGGLASVPTDGKVTLEGPHYPKPHTWYGTGTMKDGYLIAIN